MHNSNQVSSMSLLLKDHKQVCSDGLLPTRPVVGACKGLNVPLSDLLSEILEAASRGLSDSDEVVRTENLLHLVDSLNTEWDWESSSNPEKPPILLAADASALYPFLDHNTSAEVVRSEVMLSS